MNNKDEGDLKLEHTCPLFGELVYFRRSQSFMWFCCVIGRIPLSRSTWPLVPMPAPAELPGGGT